MKKVVGRLNTKTKDDENSFNSRDNKNIISKLIVIKMVFIVLNIIIMIIIMKMIEINIIVIMKLNNIVIIMIIIIMKKDNIDYIRKSL